jgi:hypothetical protein
MRRNWQRAAAVATGLAVSILAHDAAAQGYLPPLESSEEARARVREEAAADIARPEPYEAPWAPLGAPGQVVITNALNAALSSTTYTNSQASSLSGAVVAGLDYFLVKNLSIGFDLELNYGNQSGYGADGSLVKTVTSSLAGGPRVGYNVPIGRGFSFYPRATLGLEWAHRTEQVLAGSSVSIAGNPTGAPATTQVGPWVSLYAPVDLQVRPHLFLGFGPSIFRDFGRDQGGPDVGAERTRVGAGLELGGDWGGTAPPEPPAEPAPRGPTRRFGERGELVVTGDVASSAFWTTYDGTGSSNLSIAFAPGLDYFVADHVALGVAVQATYSNVIGLDGASVVHTTTTSVSITPRVAVDVPLGRWLSLYPRAGVYVGYEVQNEEEAGSANDSTQAFAGLDLFVPLLVHPAPHLFVGFGPTVRHDLAHSYVHPDGAGEQVLATTVGLGFIVGGWL